jgi:hypothetical protein
MMRELDELLEPAALELVEASDKRGDFSDERGDFFLPMVNPPL